MSLRRYCCCCWRCWARGPRRQSPEALQEYGLRFVPRREDHMTRLLETRDRAATALAEQGYIPTELYRRVGAMLEDHRAGRPSRGQR